MKKHIARSIRRVLSKLHAGTLRKDEVNYLYFKIARVEIIRPLKTTTKKRFLMKTTLTLAAAIYECDLNI